MKFPSISQVQEEAVKAFTRFPLSLIFGCISAVLACYLVERDFDTENLTYINLLLTTALGLPLFFCIDTYLEKHTHSLSIKLGVYFLGIVILGLIYLSFPNENSIVSTKAPYIRYAIYNLTIHLFVAFVPSIRNPNQLDFWNYNKTIFLRLVTGAFYSAVLFIGIALALGAIKALFNITLHEEIFAEIFFVIVFIFNTWFFLAGAPSSDFVREETIVYPKGLKIFTQFILIPLLLIYLLILYFYGAKILISGDWPEGIVSYMIIAIAVLGIFTNLLLYPYQQWKDSSWMSVFYRAYYFLLFPLIVLLFLAIGIRIQDYGLTVNRYIICCLGIWLLLISIYYASGRKNIKFIPISLAAFMILSSFGPWGMFSLSELKQRNRLLETLTENGLLLDGKIVNEVKWNIIDKKEPFPIKEKTNSLPRIELNKINSIINYLEDYHGLESVYEWFDQDLEMVIEKAVSSKNSQFSPSKIVVIAMGLEYLNRYQLLSTIETSEYRSLSLHANDEYELNLSDYDIMLIVSLDNWNNDNLKSTNQFNTRLNPDQPSELILGRDGKEYNIDLKEFIAEKIRLNPDDYINASSKNLMITKDFDDLNILLQLRELYVESENEGYKIVQLKGVLLIQEK